MDSQPGSRPPVDDRLLRLLNRHEEIPEQDNQTGEEPRRQRLTSAIPVAAARLATTPTRVFLIIALALLPLALIAMAASFVSFSASERQKQALLQAAAEQSAGKFQSEISAIQIPQRVAVESLARKMPMGNVCAPMLVVVRGGHGVDDVHLLVMDSDGNVICRPLQPGFLEPADALMARQFDQVVLADKKGGVLVRSMSSNGSLIAVTLLRNRILSRMIEPDATTESRAYVLSQNGHSVAIGKPLQGRTESATVPVGKTGLNLTMTVASPRDEMARILALVLPLAIWLAAATVGWLVARFLLIRPLVALQRAVAAYTPGEIFVPAAPARGASREFAELNTAFERMSRQVAAHDEQIHQALERQMLLTREVHHRVKNNVQVISSLINLHSRASTTPQEARAYASIQRRVDALAVVQRNHYAEVEENRGVNAQPLISEIAASLRASASQPGQEFIIEVDCDPVYLHQDVAAPVAFLIAELADQVITSGDCEPMRIALFAERNQEGRAVLMVSSDAFRAGRMAAQEGTELFSRIISGLARQLRSELAHHTEIGAYSLTLSVC